MTEQTDAEIDALWVGQQLTVPQLVQRRVIARAALAKWGAPPAVAGEPIAWRYMPSKVWGEFVYTEDPKRAQHARDNGIDVQPVFTAPQPTQAQAGAVPLTCEWAHNEDDGFWDTECGQSWRFDDGGPKENHMNFCHCCGKPLHIKGGQHGAE